MNIFFNKVFLFFIICIFFSCSSPFNCIRNFNIYKEPIIEIGNKLPLKADGIYISQDGGAAFFIYKNGKVKIHRPFFCQYKEVYQKSIEKILKDMKDDWYFNSKEWWGEYSIKNNALIIQRFNRNNNERYKRWISELSGKILNDSTIEIYSDYSYWKDHEFINTPCTLNFYSTKIKPDSSLAWFEKKKWYINELHESRRRKHQTNKTY